MSPIATHNDPAATVADDRRPDKAAAAAPMASPTGGASLVEEDLLVEDVSIDGMCGVY